MPSDCGNGWKWHWPGRQNWSKRKSTVCQAIPDNVARHDAKIIRDTFFIEKLDVEIALDETFILFRPTDDRIVAPTGVQRVGTTNPIDNDKMGLTVVVAAERRSSQLLPPFVKGTGTVGGDLFREWSQYQQSVLTSIRPIG